MAAETTSETQCFIQNWTLDKVQWGKSASVAQILGSAITIWRPRFWDLWTACIIFCDSKSRVCPEVMNKSTVNVMKTGFTSKIATCDLARNTQAFYLSTAISDAFHASSLLTYSMVQSPSWASNWFAASQEIPRISRNPKVHYRTHKRPPTVSILGQPNPVHIPTTHLLEIHPNITHPSTPRSPQWSPSLRFPHQDPIHPPLLTTFPLFCYQDPYNMSQVLVHNPAVRPVIPISILAQVTVRFWILVFTAPQYGVLWYCVCIEVIPATDVVRRR